METRAEYIVPQPPEPPPPPRRRKIMRSPLWRTGALLLIGFLVGFFAAVQLGVAPAGGEFEFFDERKVSSVFDAASPAVVEIEVIRNVGSIQLTPFWGSGFLVDADGHIVTNWHVLADGSRYIVRLSDGRELDAKRLGSSEADDLAVLKVDANQVSGISPLTLADSSAVTPGQMAIAVGSPFREFNSIGVGVVSGVGRGQTSALNRPIPDMIQTDAPLNPGNSGGPLLNSDGEVIGINSSIRVQSNGARIDDFRIGFAVPSNTARDLMPQMLASIDLRRPWIGIQGASVPRSLIENRGYPKGVYVTGVFADSPAQRAGISPFRRLISSDEGDVITAVDSVPVTSVEEMVRYLNTKSAGDEVTLTLFRQGGEVEVEVTLDAWPDGA